MKVGMEGVNGGEGGHWGECACFHRGTGARDTKLWQARLMTTGVRAQDERSWGIMK